MYFLANESVTDELSFQELIATPLGIAVIVVGLLIAILAIGSAFVSIYLAIKYIKYNHTKNLKGITGKDAARELLDRNGLQNIKVKAVGSILFGNSYSHYFKKVRLRRLTWKKSSISALAMAAQKTGLAVLDKENDKDMKDRIVLTPLISFGPLAFIPIIAVGVILDYLLFNTSGIAAVVSASLGLLFMILSFVFQIKTLKTEVKAQDRACELLREANMATEDEIDMMKKLFRLYNIEYVNNIIIAFLEIIYRILVTILKILNNSGSSSKSSN